MPDLSSTDFAWVVDAVVGVLILVSAYLALVRGFIRELFALASWVVAFFAAFAFAPLLQPALAGLPVIGPHMADCQVSMLVAFVAVFGIALIATGLVIWLFSGAIQDSAIGIVDSGLGFVYGALRGLVLVAVIYIAYQQIVPDAEQYAFVERANSIELVRGAADIIRSIMPSEVPEWLESRVNQLMGECGTGN